MASFSTVANPFTFHVTFSYPNIMTLSLSSSLDSNHHSIQWQVVWPPRAIAGNPSKKLVLICWVTVEEQTPLPSAESNRWWQVRSATEVATGHGHNVWLRGGTHSVFCCDGCCTATMVDGMVWLHCPLEFARKRGGWDELCLCETNAVTNCLDSTKQRPQIIILAGAAYCVKMSFRQVPGNSLHWNTVHQLAIVQIIRTNSVLTQD
jgi:hypothetical protein